MTFVSKAAVEAGAAAKLGVEQEAGRGREYPRRHRQADMIHNDATPESKSIPETYEVRADGELLTCEPADVLPMAQRYFLF